MTVTPWSSDGEGEGFCGRGPCLNDELEGQGPCLNDELEGQGPCLNDELEGWG